MFTYWQYNKERNEFKIRKFLGKMKRRNGYKMKINTKKEKIL